MKIKRSVIISGGVYGYEFLEDRIAVTLLSKPPEENSNWIRVMAWNTRKFYLEGTSPQDIKVVGLDHPRDYPGPTHSV
jgi:hypothetical protein